MSEEDIDRFLQRLADSSGHPGRAPLMHRPSELGLDYEDVTFPSMDGVPLEGWFIPASESEILIISSHPMGFTRAGQPTQLEPWKSVWGPSGNDFEVDFVPDYKILHDAGYNVLAFDLRSHGHSGEGNGGIATSGIFEHRDILGSLRYARERQETRNMNIGLFNRCLSSVATFYAMVKQPRAFDGVRCLVAPQPVTPKVISGRLLAIAGVPSDRIDDLDRRMMLGTSVGFSERVPQQWAKDVCIPTFLYQVHDDLLTEPSDVQTMFDNIPHTDKKLQWIHGTTARWDGYLEFQRRPQPMLEWFATYTSR